MVANVEPTNKKARFFSESGLWDTMYSTLLQHYLQKHITQDVRNLQGFDGNDHVFQLLTWCKSKKTLETKTILTLNKC